jgi:hypothetical protein
VAQWIVYEPILQNPSGNGRHSIVDAVNVARSVCSSAILAASPKSTNSHRREILERNGQVILKHSWAHLWPEYLCGFARGCKRISEGDA